MRHFFLIAVLLMLVALGIPAGSPAEAAAPPPPAPAQVDAQILAKLAGSPVHQTSFVVAMREHQGGGPGSAIASQIVLADLLAILQQAGSVDRYTPYYGANAIVVEGSRGAIRILAAQPEVAALRAYNPGEGWEAAAFLAQAGPDATGSIAGMVTGPNGTTPLSGIVVTAYRQIPPELWQFAGQATTTSAGAYTVGSLSTGIYRLRFEDPTGAYAREYYDNKGDLVSATNIGVTDGQQTSNISASLALAGRIGGTITTTGGSAIRDVVVTAYQNSGGTWAIRGYTATANNGTYSLGSLAAGTYRVGFSDSYDPPRYLDEYYDNVLDINSATNITLTAGQNRTGVNASLGGYGKITGKVTAVGGTTPLPNIQIDAYEDVGSGDWEWFASDATDTSGNYTINGLATQNYRLGFSDPANVYVPEFYNDKPDLNSADNIAAQLGGTTTANCSLLSAVYTVVKTVPAGDPAPIAFTNTGVTVDFSTSPGGTVTVTLRSLAYPSPPDGITFLYRYWSIDSNFTAPFTAVVTFTYRDIDLNGANESAIAGAARRDGTFSRWDYLPGTVDTTANTVTVPAVNRFSDFALIAPVPPRAPAALDAAACGTGVCLSWSPVTQDLRGAAVGPVQYRVYRNINGPYFNPTAGSLITTTAGTSYNHPGAFADAGHNYYYTVRAVNAAGTTSAPSNRAGKFTAAIEQGWNLLTLPLLVSDGGLDAALGAQLHGTASPETADRVLVWDNTAQAYGTSWFCDGTECQSWGAEYYRHWLNNDYGLSPLVLSPNGGFWIQNRSGAVETLSLVGRVVEAALSVPISAGWQLLGSALPVTQALEYARLPATGTDSPETADRVLYWDTSTQTYKSAWYCSGPICQSWGASYYNHWLANDYSISDIVLQPGRGFWFQNRHTPLTWINRP